MSGCAHWPAADTPAAREGRQAVERLRALNSGLRDCKGLGRAALITRTGTQRTRLAWAARSPDKLRLELLAVSGHPLAAIASDGEYLYLRDNSSDRFYKNRSPRASLEPLVSLPVRVPDLIAYLTGRVPLVDVGRSRLMDNPRQPGYILEMIRWWGEVAQRIFLEADGRTVARVIHFDAAGNPAYQVELADYRPDGSFSFARQLSITNTAEHRLDIRLERFWPNTAIDDGAFQLTR
jgi:outer membrane lipoprotein-sorting protein